MKKHWLFLLPVSIASLAMAEMPDSAPAKTDAVPARAVYEIQSDEQKMELEIRRRVFQSMQNAQGQDKSVSAEAATSQTNVNNVWRDLETSVDRRADRDDFQ